MDLSSPNPIESLLISDPVESLTDTEIDESTLPYALSVESPIDPVDVLVHFISRIASRPSKKFPIPLDRDRLIVTILLAILSDPHHHLNEYITRPLLRVYTRRGGKVYRPGNLARNMSEEDQFDHSAQYLYDYGLSISEIARALSSSRNTVMRRLKHLREEDKKNIDKYSTES